MEGVYDCHTHTNCSDGALSPTALLDLAKHNNLTGISITDHDTVSALEIAIPYAKTLDLILIPGIEISSEYQKMNVHVLGYGFDVDSPALQTFCALVQERRVARNQAIVERLSRQGIRISYEELQQRFPEQASLGRPHIARLLFEKGVVRSPQQAFVRYIGEKCRFFVPGIQISTQEAIDFLHELGAFAVLAHPHYLAPSIIPFLAEMPFDGIEAYSGRTSLVQAQPWLSLAEKKGWFVTGGSDFHGHKKQNQPLGCSWTPPETAALLLDPHIAPRRSKVPV